MKVNTRRIMLLGHAEPYRLEHSYQLAFEKSGCEVLVWDIAAAAQQRARFGRLGRIFHQFVPVEPWLRKANREFVVKAIDVHPSLIAVIGSCPVQPGALAQAQISTGAQLVHIWPDTLVHLSAGYFANLLLYDLVGTYSRATIPHLERLGARRTIWLPLAGDPQLHSQQDQPRASDKRFLADVTFIGGWRPEREAVLSQLGEFKLQIWGPEWGRRCKGNRVIKRAWQGRAIVGAEFVRAVCNSKVSINIIDPTNYPAANMRFFEIPVSGGLQISSQCPEMEEEFRHGEHIFYYRRMDELPELIKELLAHDILRTQVSAAAYDKVLASHTYWHRAQQILHELDTDS
jgi:spore maturation protein CgeB